MLEKGGISHSDVHALALSYALAQNIYSKSEINEMLEIAMKRFEMQMHEFRTEMKADMHDLRTELKADMHDLRTELKDDIHELRTELKSDIHDLRVEIKQDMQGLEASIDKKLSTKLGLFTAIITIVIAISHFIN